MDKLQNIKNKETATDSFVRKEEVYPIIIGHELRLFIEIYKLQILWKLLTSKLYELRQDKIYETRRDEKMRLDQIIEEIEVERQKIEHLLNEYEAELEPYIENRIGKQKAIFLNNY